MRNNLVFAVSTAMFIFAWSRWGRAIEWDDRFELPVELVDQLVALGNHDGDPEPGDEDQHDGKAGEDAGPELHSSTRMQNPMPRIVWISFGSTLSSLRRR